MNQSLYQKMLLLPKFNDIGGKALEPKKISLQPQKKNEAVYDCVWLCLMSVVYQDPKFLIFQKLHNQQNQTQWHKVNYSDFFLYQNASTSRILDTSPQGLISSIINKEAYRKHQKASRKPQGSYKNFQGRNPYNIFVAIGKSMSS